MIHCHFCERKADPYYIVRFPTEAERGKEYYFCATCQAARKDFLYCSPPLRVESGIPAEQRPRLLAIDFLQDNPYQPRLSMEDESLFQLAETIESQGFQGVLEARPHPEQSGTYQLTAGHRRREAARLAGLIELPVIVRARSDREMAALAATENIQREDLSPLEEGRLFQMMIDVLGMKQTEVSDLVKKDRSYVRNRLRLANAPEDIQAFVATKDDGLSAAYYLAEIEDPAERALIIEQLHKKTLSTNDLPLYIEEMKRHKVMAAQVPMTEVPAQSSLIEPAAPSQEHEPITQLSTMEQPVPVQEHEPAAQVLATAPLSPIARPSSEAVAVSHDPVQVGPFMEPSAPRSLADAEPVSTHPTQVRSIRPPQADPASVAAHAAAQESVRQRRLKSILFHLNQYQELIPPQGHLSEKECAIVQQILTLIQAFPSAHQARASEA
ncbi:MAG TPA: ParB/RepB/Spo0J family partition protein [Ktedonosporobacter sp.]|nr:ParB/RepB/Spo0J family partition protein [Ktedonosporobacter sp.]